ncbi:MAG: FAD binding domain-containing protein [Pseudomonadota bacterium]
MLYKRPLDLADALALRAAGPWTPLGGGTDLYPATTAAELAGPILDVTAVAALKGIQETDAAWRLGAAVTWREVIDAALPPAFYALQAAAREVGGIQIQNAGTLAGNLCNASPAADGVPPLLALDAEVELASQSGSRRLALQDFITGPRQTALAPDELLVALWIPKTSCGGASAFLKLGARAYLVISIAMVVARVVVTEGRLAELALAVGSCSAVARRLPSLEERLLGLTSAEAQAQLDDASVAAALSPIDDPRASAAYRSEAAAELLRRALSAAFAKEASA